MPTDHPTDKSHDRADDGLTRRTFLSRVWLAMGVAVTGEAAFIGLRYFGSRKSDSPFGSVIDAGSPDEYPPGTITEFTQARFYLVRFEAGGFLALYTRCTHLACLVSWEDDLGRFNCPCHGSQFDREGDVLNTPAPRPLDHFPITLEDGTLRVDTGDPMQRDSISDDDMVYIDLDAVDDDAARSDDEE